MSDTLYAIAGLGNPGPEYEQTRHNAGFWFVDVLAQRHHGSFRREAKFQGLLARVRIAGAEVLLFKPMTFMNRSGQAVSALCQFYRIPPAQLLVAHDDLDLPPGTVRLKLGGGHGGHNGLRDIHKPLGPDYRRLRVGIGHPGDRSLVLDYVLSRPSRADEDAIRRGIEEAADAVETWLRQGPENPGWDKAMQQLHTPPR